MSDMDQLLFCNGKRYTKLQKVTKGIEQCLMSSDQDGYETQCADCPYFDPDITVERCRSLLQEDALDVLRQTRTYKKFFNEVSTLPGCNTCDDKYKCKYLVSYGEYVRFNCPLWKGGEG